MLSETKRPGDSISTHNLGSIVIKDLWSQPLVQMALDGKDCVLIPRDLALLAHEPILVAEALHLGEDQRPVEDEGDGHHSIDLDELLVHRLEVELWEGQLLGFKEKNRLNQKDFQKNA